MLSEMAGQLGKVVASARATFMEGRSRYIVVGNIKHVKRRY